MTCCYNAGELLGIFPIKQKGISMRFPERIVIAIAGIAIILICTGKYGIGLAPDTAGYFSAADSLLAGNGLIYYQGLPLVAQPPIYSVLLAIFTGAFRDMGTSALVLNVILYICLIFLSYTLFYRHSNSRMVAIVFVFGIAISIVTIDIAIMALTEMLFVVLVLLFMVTSDLWNQHHRVVDVIALAFVASVSFLVRYIGISVVLVGFFVIALSPLKLIRRLYFLVLYSGITFVLCGSWLVRNYLVAHTLLGPRSPSTTPLLLNLKYTVSTIAEWFLPNSMVTSEIVIVIAGLVLGCVVWNAFTTDRKAIVQVAPAILFIICYLTLLIWSSTTSQYDAIGVRLLAPLYIPLLLVIMKCLISSSLVRLKFGRWAMGTVAALWISWLIVTSSIIISGYAQDGPGGYSTQKWQQSELVVYMRQHGHELDLPVYSNIPDVLYLVAGIRAKSSLVKESELPHLVKVFGYTSFVQPSYLVWHKPNEGRSYFYTPEELRATTSLHIEQDIMDGAIYKVGP